MTPQGEQLTRKADEELLPLVADADPDAFEVFYERHADAAFALAHRICGSGAAADDVCQEAFVDAWRSAGRYDARLGSARSWLLTIVHHRAIDQIRRTTRLRDRTVNDEAAAERVAAADDTERAALETAQRAEAEGLLATLPAEQRHVVSLAFYSGYSHSEIAELLDTPLGTIKSRMRRALGALRDHLEEGASA
jgi:RNA polymerase sigma-70 factor (ECF subfamily)